MFFGTNRYPFRSDKDAERHVKCRPMSIRGKHNLIFTFFDDKQYIYDTQEKIEYLILNN